MKGWDGKGSAVASQQATPGSPACAPGAERMQACTCRRAHAHAGGGCGRPRHARPFPAACCWHTFAEMQAGTHRQVLAIEGAEDLPVRQLFSGQRIAHNHMVVLWQRVVGAREISRQSRRSTPACRAQPTARLRAPPAPAQPCFL